MDQLRLDWQAQFVAFLEIVGLSKVMCVQADLQWILRGHGKAQWW